MFDSGRGRHTVGVSPMAPSRDLVPTSVGPFVADGIISAIGKAVPELFGPVRADRADAGTQPPPRSRCVG